MGTNEGMGAGTGSLGLDRECLPERTEAVLSRGGIGNADVLLVRVDGPQERVVVKDFGSRRGFLRRFVGRWLLAREARIYGRLEGLESVPRLLGRLDAESLVIEYRPGRMLSRSLAPDLPEDFMDALRAAVAAMHERGVVHLDLRHRDNVLADADGRVVLVDFASAIALDPGNPLARRVLGWLARIDAGALRKWEERVGPRAASRQSAGAASAPPSTGSAGSRGASRPM